MTKFLEEQSEDSSRCDILITVKGNVAAMYRLHFRIVYHVVSENLNMIVFSMVMKLVHNT